MLYYSVLGSCVSGSSSDPSSILALLKFYWFFFLAVKKYNIEPIPLDFEAIFFTV